MKEVASAVTSSKQACDEPMTQEQCDTTKTSKAHKNGIMFSGPSQNQSYEPCGGLFDDFTSRVHHAGSYFYIRAKFRVLVEHGVFPLPKPRNECGSSCSFGVVSGERIFWTSSRSARLHGQFSSHKEEIREELGSEGPAKDTRGKGRQA
jgi:hypothetical protein